MNPNRAFKCSDKPEVLLWVQCGGKDCDYCTTFTHTKFKKTDVIVCPVCGCRNTWIIYHTSHLEDMAALFT